MTKATYTRHEAVETLVNYNCELFNQGQISLDDILWYGWKGYDKRSNEELASNLKVYFEEQGEPFDEVVVIDK